MEDLKRDKNYTVFTVRVKLDQPTSEVENVQPVDLENSSAAIGGTDPLGATPTSTISVEADHEATSALCAALEVYEVDASQWDSVADLHVMLQGVLQIPQQLRHQSKRGRSGGHELLSKGQLMADHLLLADYALCHGDILHFAMRHN